ncbi:DNA-binding protein [Acinetobacter sp. B5B]|uniref:plasmid replication DNA-binding protein n=1 Tax=Acinetobacter baretiae TaxID=2605383 RepID=UPI0018C1FB15|nr:plasmid replication DNA-binding protein [Acinetobacter baretiae]MBF7684087.1 DNA-binding protein [Acinetobacter baretiae]
MAKLSLNEVAKNFSVSRSTLYRAVKEGRISRGADGLFDVAEVIRCFGDAQPSSPKNNNLNDTEVKKDDSDLRQLIDFMKREIDGYKDREQRYLDQIERFQLLLEYKEKSDETSHETSETISNNMDLSTDIKDNLKCNLSHETVKGASDGVSVKHHETRINDDEMMSKTTESSLKKRGFWSKFFLPND